MDVTRTKDQKLFSLGKKFAQLTADCKKLRATTRTFYLKNWKLTNFDEDKLNQLDSHINKIEYELEYMENMYEIKPDFLTTIEPIMADLQSTMLDCKINLISLFEENSSA